MGDKQQALEYYQQALAIYREVGDRRGEASTLHNLGHVYDDLGNKSQALEYYQQALVIYREVDDRQGEGKTQGNIGALALRQHHYDLALAAFLLARQCFQEVSSPQQHKAEEGIAALHQQVGQEQWVALRARVEPQARQCFEQAPQKWHAQHEK